jgi:cytochrome b561
MPLANTSSRYGSVSQAIHWLTVALVIALLVSGKVTDIEADHPGDIPFLWHGSLGVLVLVLVLSRIVWAFISPAPPFPRTMTRAARLGARTMHLALYVLLVALPLSGWLTASSEGASVNFFGVVSIPSWDLSNSRANPAAAEGEAVGAEAAGERSKEFFEEFHEVLSNALLIFASFHALVALKHHFLNRDDVLKRMLPQSKRPRSPEVAP